MVAFSYIYMEGVSKAELAHGTHGNHRITRKKIFFHCWLSIAYENLNLCFSV